MKDLEKKGTQAIEEEIGLIKHLGIPRELLLTIAGTSAAAFFAREGIQAGNHVEEYGYFIAAALGGLFTLSSIGNGTEMIKDLKSLKGALNKRKGNSGEIIYDASERAIDY